jgi:hypothetical protein
MAVVILRHRANERQHFVDDGRQIMTAARFVVPPRELEKLPRDLLAAKCFALDHSEILPHHLDILPLILGTRLDEPRLERFGGEGDRLHRIVDFMRDAGREKPDSGEPFRTDELLEPNRGPAGRGRREFPGNCRSCS